MGGSDESGLQVRYSDGASALNMRENLEFAVSPRAKIRTLACASADTAQWGYKRHWRFRLLVVRCGEYANTDTEMISLTGAADEYAAFDKGVQKVVSGGQGGSLCLRQLCSSTLFLRERCY